MGSDERREEQIVQIIDVVLIEGLQNSWNDTMGIDFFFQAEDSIRGSTVPGVQTCAHPISFAVCAWILPAVSGSFLLLVTGTYEHVLDRKSVVQG